MGVPLLKPTRSTARLVFAGVAERLQVEPSLLEYLFNECLNEVLAEAQTTGSCTLRGLGKFQLTTLAKLAEDNHLPVLLDSTAKSQMKVMVFDRTRHAVKNTPFAAFRLSSRLASFPTSA